MTPYEDIMAETSVLPLTADRTRSSSMWSFPENLELNVDSAMGPSYSHQLTFPLASFPLLYTTYSPCWATDATVISAASLPELLFSVHDTLEGSYEYVPSVPSVLFIWGIDGRSEYTSVTVADSNAKSVKFISAMTAVPSAFASTATATFPLEEPTDVPAGMTNFTACVDESTDTHDAGRPIPGSGVTDLYVHLPLPTADGSATFSYPSDSVPYVTIGVVENEYDATVLPSLPTATAYASLSRSATIPRSSSLSAHMIEKFAWYVAEPYASLTPNVSVMPAVSAYLRMNAYLEPS